jgi:RNA polymerase sigma factor (TIGR02999 family)
MTSLTQLIEQAGAGSQAARDELFATAYAELRQLARSRLHSHSGHAHESYLRFVNSGQLRLGNRKAFFAYASKVMRSVVIDTVRELQAQRRGGGDADLELDTQLRDSLPAGGAEILHVHDALLALEDAEPRLAKVVEMRYFGGYSDAEIAEALELTERTVRRDWEKARLLLKALLWS